MGPYRTPGSVLADEPKKKLEKLTFTPTRVIEIERTGVPDNQPEAVRNRKLNAVPCDTRHPPQEHEMDPRGEYCVRCLRTRAYVEATKSIKVVADPNVPQDEMWFIGTDGTRAIPPKAFALAKAELYKRATVPVDEEYAVRVAGHWHLPPGLYSNARVYLPTYRDDMVNTIIASQVAAGGVDTDGTRAQAERWCAMLAGCVCEGMRATTLMGSLKLRRNDMWGCENAVRGKPLGRP